MEKFIAGKSLSWPSSCVFLWYRIIKPFYTERFNFIIAYAFKRLNIEPVCYILKRVQTTRFLRASYAQYYETNEHLGFYKSHVLTFNFKSAIVHCTLYVLLLLKLNSVWSGIKRNVLSYP